MTKVRLLAFAAMGLWTSLVNGQIIFQDSFEIPESVVNCPGAIPLTESTNSLGGVLLSASGVIDPPGDTDYFSFPATDQQWFQISTRANLNSDPALIDTVVSVFSSDGLQLLARSDDATPRVSTDSELIYRSTVDNDLCIKIEDASTFSGLPPEGGATFTYTINASPVDFTLYDGFNDEVEPNDTTATAQTGLSTNETFNFQAFTRITGDFQNNTDSDVYQLTAPTGALVMQLRSTPTGKTGFGGTADLGRMEIIANDGVEILASLDPTQGATLISLPVQMGTDYFIRSASPTLPLGNNPFYVLLWETRSQQNQQETNDIANITFAGAEVANPIMGISTVSHFFGGTLDGVSDTDWWSFAANTGDSVNLFCASWRSGSGVRNATFNIFDNPAAAPLQTETEIEGADISWSNLSTASRPPVSITTTGTHYLAVIASQFSPTVTSRFYICGLHVISPP